MLKHIKNKISDFIKKYGFTVKSYFIAVVLLPPAAVYITYKHPNWNRLQQGLAYCFIVFFLAVMPIVAHTAVMSLADTVQHYFL